MDSERSIHRWYSIPNTAVGLCSIVVNSFLIHALRRLDKIKNISFKLVVLLSVLDICMGISLCAHEILLQLIATEEGFLILRIYAAAILYTLCELEGLVILVIAVDRLIHMKYPTRYSSIVTNRRAIGAVAVVSILSLAHAASEVYAVLFHAEEFFLDQLLVSCVIVAVLVALTVTYIFAYISVHRSTMPRQDQGNARPSTRPVRDASREMSRAVIVVLTTLWALYMPVAISGPARMHHTLKGDPAVLHVFLASELLLFSNSTLNAFIFIAFNTDIRAYTSQRLKCCCCRGV